MSDGPKPESPNSQPESLSPREKIEERRRDRLGRRQRSETGEDSNSRREWLEEEKKVKTLLLQRGSGPEDQEAEELEGEQLGLYRFLLTQRLDFKKGSPYHEAESLKAVLKARDEKISNFTDKEMRRRSAEANLGGEFIDNTAEDNRVILDDMRAGVAELVSEDFEGLMNSLTDDHREKAKKLASIQFDDEPSQSGSDES